MRVSSIQPTLYRAQNQQQSFRKTDCGTTPTQSNPSFKGNGKGLLAGLTTGITTGLLVVGGAAITGLIVLPAIIGGAAIVGSGIGGAVLGDKIEDKIDEHKKKKDQ